MKKNKLFFSDPKVNLPGKKKPKWLRDLTQKNAALYITFLYVFSRGNRKGHSVGGGGFCWKHCDGKHSLSKKVGQLQAKKIIYSNYIF